jgi:Ca-activated chloride channel homolog
MPQLAFQSAWYWLSALVPASVPVFYWFLFRRRRRSILLPTMGLIPSAGRKRSSVSFLGWVFSSFSLLTLVPVIAGIEQAGQPQPEPSALVVVLDTSSSMTADDFVPSGRLEEAKKHLQRFVAANRFSELGIVTYAGSPHLLTPTTTDHAATHTAIAAIRAVGYGEDGTAIGSAIAAAVNRLRAGSWSERRILLITDGVNNAGPISPLDAASLARTLNIRIDTLGIGSDRISRFWVPSPEGAAVAVEARIEIDEKTLEDIARETGGTYVRARNSRELLEALLAVSGPEARISSERPRPDPSGPARILLVSAIVLLGSGFILSHLIAPEIPG